MKILYFLLPLIKLISADISCNFCKNTIELFKEKYYIANNKLKYDKDLKLVYCLSNYETDCNDIHPEKMLNFHLYLVDSFNKDYNYDIRKTVISRFKNNIPMIHEDKLSNNLNKTCYKLKLCQ